TPSFPDKRLDLPITADDMAADLARLDLMVDRARENGIVNHVAFVTGFFHAQTPMRFGAVRQDVRNAQWFADGWIADPSELRNPRRVPLSVWVTPSRYAQPFRTRVEEGVRILAKRAASLMK